MKRQNHISVLFLLMAVLYFSDSQAQQDPQYTQYMYNMNVINPAYAGSKESLSITALYRNQWTGIEGNPRTLTFSAHSPLGNEIGLGLSAIKDELGPVSETNVYADFSYTLQLSPKLKLALGLKAGVSFHKVGLTNLELQDPNDPFFSQNIDNSYLNIGAGTFLYSEDFYLGISVPNMLSSVHLDENGIKYGSETQHYFVAAGYVFEISDDFKLKPSFMLKSAFDAPISFDVNLNALFYERFEIGASYRLDDSFNGIIGFQITPNIWAGYAYDHVNSELKAVGPSSHEVILTFDLFFRPTGTISPRFF
ncbi:MAG: type IX secretion system membrane protein PorP/SprF [Aequorivita sp.]